MEKTSLDRNIVRPTPAVVRKAIFDILKEVEGKVFVDMYAGKGLVGLEALKRGASEVIFVERDPVLCTFIKNNLQKHKLMDRARVYKIDALVFIRDTNFQYDVIFADPPYNSGEVERMFNILEKKNLLKNNGVLIIQHSKKESLREKLKDLRIFKCYRYGDTLLTVYRSER